MLFLPSGSIMDCDAVLLMSDGRLVEQGPPRELAAGTGTFASLVQASGWAQSRAGGGGGDLGQRQD